MLWSLSFWSPYSKNPLGAVSELAAKLLPAMTTQQLCETTAL